MKRDIQRWIDDYLTDALLQNPQQGTIFKISYDPENDITKIESEKKKRTTRKKKTEE